MDKVILKVNSSESYSADAEGEGLTLLDLMERIERAIEDFGEDAQVVFEDPYASPYDLPHGFIAKDEGVTFEGAEEF